MANAAKATPPKRKNFVAFTGSDTEPVRTKTVTAAAPIERKLANDFSEAVFNIT
jgi:hypothetical protein